MSSTTDYFLEVEEERADEWVRAKYAYENSDEEELDQDSEEYKALLQEYYDHQEYLADEAQWQAELEWLKENGSSAIHRSFISSLDLLKNMTETSRNAETFWTFSRESDMRIKMAVSYAVTLLEAFLRDTLKSLVSENDAYLKNAIVNLKFLKDEKIISLANFDLNLREFVIREINDELLHNMKKVIDYYRGVLGVDFIIDTSKVSRITNARHDIVHRDGRTPDGDKVNLEYIGFNQIIEDIKEFTGELQRVINESSGSP